MSKIFLPCQHRWQIIAKLYKTKLEWITVQKCRKCDLKRQSNYSVSLQNKMQVSCITTPIDEVKNEI